MRHNADKKLKKGKHHRSAKVKKYKSRVHWLDNCPNPKTKGQKLC